MLIRIEYHISTHELSNSSETYNKHMIEKINES